MDKRIRCTDPRLTSSNGYQPNNIHIVFHHHEGLYSMNQPTRNPVLGVVRKLR